MIDSPLRQKLIDELTLRGFSKNTITSYVWCVRRIAKHFMRPPDDVRNDELRELLLELCREPLATSTLNVIVSAWIFFYDQVLGRDVTQLKTSLPRTKKAKVQIRAYSKDEVRAILYDSELNLKHATFLSTVYHAGLRVSEAVNLQIGDIQSSNAVILVRKGKGKKDRYTLLPERLLTELRNFYGQYRPQKPWIFTSQMSPNQPIAENTGQLPQSSLSEMPAARGRGVACASGTGAASGEVFPCGVHGASPAQRLGAFQSKGALHPVVCGGIANTPGIRTQ